MIYTCRFTGKKNYYNLAVEKDRDSIFTTVTTIYENKLYIYANIFHL